MESLLKKSKTRAVAFPPLALRHPSSGRIAHRPTGSFPPCTGERTEPPFAPRARGPIPACPFGVICPFPFPLAFFFFFLPGESGTAAKLRDLTLSLPQREERSRQPPAPTGSGRPGGQWDGRLRLPGGGGEPGSALARFPGLNSPAFGGKIPKPAAAFAGKIPLVALEPKRGE